MKVSLFMTVFMLTWQFNHGLIHTILCNVLVGVLPVESGCTCSARFRLFTYLANLKLTDCDLKLRTCFDGKAEILSESICGTPSISTDLYLRQRESLIGIGLNDIKGFDNIFPAIPNNPVISNRILITGIFFELFLKTGLDIANLANSINITRCNFYFGDNKEQKCNSCSACNDGKGISFDCSNINVVEVIILNNTKFNITLPTPPTCFKIPGIPGL